MSRPPAPVPPELRGGPFSRRTALRVVTDRTLSGPAYQRVLRGAHVTTGTEVSHRLRIQAARAVLPPDAVLGGRSALWAWGAEVAGPDEPVEVVLPAPRRVRNRSHVRVRGDVLLPGEVVDSALGPVTSAARTAFDLGRRGGTRQSVPLLDALARATGVTAEDVGPLVATHRGVRGLTRLPAALAAMDGRAESPRESLLRLVLTEVGFPPLAVQYTVRDRRGHFIARVDLAWPDLRIAVEYDGAHHDDPTQIPLDRRRLNALHECGWTVLVVDRHQLADEARLVSMVRTVRIRAHRRAV